MNNQKMIERLIVGAAAGVAATFVLRAAKQAIEKRAPSAKTPMRKDAGRFIVERAEAMVPPSTAAKIPPKVESVAQQSSRLLYGAAFGVLYALTRGDAKGVLLEGAGLGLSVWAIGYLGWLPAVHIMPPITRQRRPQVIAPMVEHVLYGVTAVSAIRAFEHQRAS